MKIVLPGGSGQVGQVLARHFSNQGHDIVVLCRGDRVPSGRTVSWDGKTLGAWASEIDGADVIINLAGRTVNCRYTPENLRQMMDSRVDSTRVVGQAIEKAAKPPKLWLQMSTATIYAHRFDAPNDEATGIIGGNEPDVPGYWGYSVEIATNWEKTLAEANTPNTRKVALRASMIMSPDREGIFDVMSKLVRFGLSGSAAGGKQFVSWIHDRDFIRALEFLMEHEEIAGAVNIASPGPLPYNDFMAAMRQAWGMPIGLPAMKWMLEIGAWVMRTDTELVLKSRRVVPGRLLEKGFVFDFPEWNGAVKDLVARWKAGK
ncbi:MAG TPA: DUF1731 domain-containing protein [Polyangium sp.]|nr:DUF1731 domain-containing protein [Polyangium sp.]